MRGLGIDRLDSRRALSVPAPRRHRRRSRPAGRGPDPCGALAGPAPAALHRRLGARPAAGPDQPDRRRRRGDAGRARRVVRAARRLPARPHPRAGLRPVRRARANRRRRGGGHVRRRGAVGREPRGPAGARRGAGAPSRHLGAHRGRARYVGRRSPLPGDPGRGRRRARRARRRHPDRGGAQRGRQRGAAGRRRRSRGDPALRRVHVDRRRSHPAAAALARADDPRNHRDRPERARRRERPRRAGPARPHLQLDAGPARAGVRRPEGLPRRRRPRAAHPDHRDPRATWTPSATIPPSAARRSR